LTAADRKIRRASARARNVAGAERSAGRRRFAELLALDEIEDAPFGGGVGQDELHMQHEAVELRLRQRKHAFLLDRILRGDRHEGIGQGVRLAGDGRLPLGHGLEQRRLHFRRRSIDLVDEQQRMKDRSRGKFEHAAVLPPDRRAGDVGGHQIGRALDAREGEIERARQELRRPSLGEARRALEENVPVGEQPDQQPLDERLRADQMFVQKRLDLDEAGAWRIHVIPFA
jgi:hypothetical protein